MLFSRSEDHLFLSQDLESYKQHKDQKNNRNRNSTTTTTSVSATNSPLLPQRNLYGNSLNRITGGSSLSVANTNTSGSLHSVSSDESTAAVVSLPVTTPFRSTLTANAVGSVQHSASLMSLAKPIISTNGPSVTKSKIPVTVSLNALSEMGSAKRPNTLSGSIPSGSLLSGNTIPVNINQKPLKSTNISDPLAFNHHISSSLPSFPKHTATGLPNILTNMNPFSTNQPSKGRIQSPVKSPIKAVSPIDTVLSVVPGIKRPSANLTVDPFVTPTLSSDIDIPQHLGLPLDSGNTVFTAVGHNLLTTNSVNELNSDPPIPPGFTPSSVATSLEKEKETDPEDLGNGVTVPTLSSGVLQVSLSYYYEIQLKMY